MVNELSVLAMRTINWRRRFVAAGLVLCASLVLADDQLPVVDLTQTQEAPAQATLFVLNISGPTLFASNQEITDNGSDLVSLPRNAFKRVPIASGLHEFRFKPFPQGKRVAHLNAQAGNTYYLVVGYSPGKSWAFPLAGDPMLIKMVDEAEAAPLMKDMAELQEPAR